MPPSTIATRIATIGSMPGARPTQAIGERHHALRDARAVEDRADQHEHRQREQRVLGDARRACSAAPRAGPTTARRRWRATIATMPPMPSATAIGTPASISPTNTTNEQRRRSSAAAALDSARCLVVGRGGERRVSTPGVPAACAARALIASAERRRPPRGEPPARHAQPHRGLAPADLVGDHAHRTAPSGPANSQRRRDGRRRQAQLAPPARRCRRRRRTRSGCGRRAGHRPAAPASVITTIRNDRDLLGPRERLVGEVARDHVAAA